MCTLPKLIGEGPFSKTGWFYNTDSMKCERFMFGESQGNRNIFRTKWRCERLCNGVSEYIMNIIVFKKNLKIIEYMLKKYKPKSTKKKMKKLECPNTVV